MAATYQKRRRRNYKSKFLNRFLESQNNLQEWELSNTAVLLKNEYGDKEWTFDRVFDENSNSENVYQEVVSPIVSQALEGYNGKYSVLSTLIQNESFLYVTSIS